MLISDLSSDVCSSYLVQIKLKDLLLGEFAFQGQRQNHFPELAGEAVAVVEKYVAGDLLRNCGGALHPTARAAIFDGKPSRARHADRVDAGVHIIALVFGRHHGIDHHLRNLIVRQRSEEHTSELQSTNAHLVCRLLIEKTKQKKTKRLTNRDLQIC